MSIFTEPRSKLVSWMRYQLIGPQRSSAHNSADLIGVLPTDRYPCGALYPITESGEGLDPVSDELENSLLPDDESPETVVTKRYIPPSSLGFSFFVKGDDIKLQILCGAACYDKIQGNKSKSADWKHRSLASHQLGVEDFENVVCPRKNSRQSFSKFKGRASLDTQWRKFADGWIVTISLCNSTELSDGLTGREFVEERAKYSLFEASLRCVIDAGEIGVYPRVDRSVLGEEQQEIELQYCGRHIFAIGHGCAVNWDVREGIVKEICSDTMPAVEVAQMTADTGVVGEPVLSISRLSSLDTSHEKLVSELNEFINGYADWVDEIKHGLTDTPEDDLDAARRISGRMSKAVSRMRSGLALLTDNKQVRLAFALANRGMLDQMRQADAAKGTKRSDDVYRWRPFQLAFLLTTIDSTADEDSDFRDTVDLIWFPTGGGKTEAYLGLIAFLITLRRLRYPDTGGGTAVLMRYTLRLLTRDQFVRAARLICALELIRRVRSDLGAEVISIGMWVGSPTSPNTYAVAEKIVKDAVSNGTKPELVIEECPWCCESFTAEQNYNSTKKRFHFLCRNPECSYGNSGDGVLPCNIVDEALYENPPSMLVATVDKFARLAWEDRANSFFGGAYSRPPELIIQDELHLIASALGSVAGVYEASIDTVIQLRGVYPKYIASTATIRMADQQVNRLYGREVAIFPPPGLSCDDSYFARTVPLKKRPGRVYVGYLAPLLNRQKCMAPLAAALLLAPSALFESEENRDELLDAWWTQMVYHGSLKGVGNSHTAFSRNVREFMLLLLGTTKKYGEDQSHSDLEGSVVSSDKYPPQDSRSRPIVAQLTSLQTASENADVFARLSEKKGSDGCLDAVLATNMISVGLDVSRLALMVINGQPLSTAEYIQASSRVGRSDTPGLVFVNYYRDQARSLSYYESFRPYHEAFYRFVEPTSVTPYTYQARLRALPAALVIVVRHSKLGLLGNESAGHLNMGDSKTAQAIEQFKRRCRLSSGDQAEEVTEHIDTLIKQWQEELQSCDSSSRELYYQVSDRDRGRDRLLYNYNDCIKGLWPALQSLRNVENTALLKVL